MNTWSRGLGQGPAGALPAAHHPLQVFEKATRIRRKYKCDKGHGKIRHEGCMVRPRKATGRPKKQPHEVSKFTRSLSGLAQILSNLLRGTSYPVKGLFGAAPQIARNSG